MPFAVFLCFARRQHRHLLSFRKANPVLQNDDSVFHPTTSNHDGTSILVTPLKFLNPEFGRSACIGGFVSTLSANPWREIGPLPPRRFVLPARQPRRLHGSKSCLDREARSGSGNSSTRVISSLFVFMGFIVIGTLEENQEVGVFQATHKSLPVARRPQTFRRNSNLYP